MCTIICKQMIWQLEGVRVRLGVGGRRWRRKEVQAWGQSNMEHATDFTITVEYGSYYGETNFKTKKDILAYSFGTVLTVLEYCKNFRSTRKKRYHHVSCDSLRLSPQPCTRKAATRKVTRF